MNKPFGIKHQAPSTHTTRRSAARGVHHFQAEKAMEPLGMSLGHDYMGLGGPAPCAVIMAGKECAWGGGPWKVFE